MHKIASIVSLYSSDGRAGDCRFIEDIPRSLVRFRLERNFIFSHFIYLFISLTLCDSGYSDGLLSHWALPSQVRILSVSLTNDI